MISKNIKSLRCQKGISQMELSIKTNMRQSQISKIENGLRKVSSEELILISKALRVPISKLLELEEAKEIVQ
ncbi:helix-turn-helix domain-containing protein [Clostridium sp. WILCCON 0269]|uniref:Helix-turn-helix domain-containing protein n=1 Tax=Candidatus Clostridium eludens TaxID=3381663 RepID=A0ABW8SVK7_9CLOT